VRGNVVGEVEDVLLADLAEPVDESSTKRPSVEDACAEELRDCVDEPERRGRPVRRRRSRSVDLAVGDLDALDGAVAARIPQRICAASNAGPRELRCERLRDEPSTISEFVPTSMKSGRAGRA